MCIEAVDAAVCLEEGVLSQVLCCSKITGQAIQITHHRHLIMLHDFFERVDVALAYRFYDPGFIHKQRLLFPSLTIMLGNIKTGQDRNMKKQELNRKTES
ncbi:MAG: hypothetical protein PHV74_08935 [Dehalococcoidia bacterium]|nr:hypothetical protein [Dehalococcoidia bacterium]